MKSFILGEEVRTSHAERYVNYLDRYSSQVYHDLRRELEGRWAGEIKKLSKKLPLPDDHVKVALLHNPKLTPELTLVSARETVTSPRYQRSLDVSPSVKVPLLYSAEERYTLTQQLLTAAEETLKKVTSAWGEVLKYEIRGRLLPWFKIVRDADEVRLQLAMSSGGREEYKTLYAVRVEHGRSNSKLRGFDRIYLVNLT